MRGNGPQTTYGRGRRARFSGWSGQTVPRPLSKPGADAGPKSDAGQGPKKGRKRCPWYLLMKDEAEYLVLPYGVELSYRERVTAKVGEQDRETRRQGLSNASVAEKKAERHTWKLIGKLTATGKTKDSWQTVQRFRQSHGGSSSCLFRRPPSRHAPPKQKTPPAISISSTQANSP